MKKRSVFALLFFIAMTGAFWFNSLFNERGVAVTKDLFEDLKIKRMLVVFAHPDDELTSYALLSRSRASSVETYMLTLTEGEKGYYEPYVSRREDLGTIRRAEVLKSGFFLGIGTQKVAAYPDGELEKNTDTIVAEIRDVICSFEPDTILTFDPASGFTGHADHKVTGAHAIAALNSLSDTPCSSGTYKGVKTVLFPVMPRQILNKLGGATGAEVAQNSRAPTHAIKSQYSLKIKGWSIHDSQSDFVRQQWKLPLWLVYLAYDKEYYSQFR